MACGARGRKYYIFEFLAGLRLAMPGCAPTMTRRHPTGCARSMHLVELAKYLARMVSALISGPRPETLRPAPVSIRTVYPVRHMPRYTVRGSHFGPRLP